MHMKRHLYERLRSHRRKYLNIDIYISTIRANVTHILPRTHTPSQYSWVDSLPLMTPSTTH